MIQPFLTLPTFQHAKRDIPAGLVVFLVALPLCLGIALASGAPLLSGIIGGVVGGLVISLLSGSELSVSGPAAGLTAIVAAAIIKLGGFQVFTVAVILSGLLQFGLGLVRAGVIGDYIPNSVIKGMLAAIGIVIILKQIPHALGDDRDFLGDEAFQQSGDANTLTEMMASIISPSPGAVVITIISLLLILFWERPFMKARTWTGWVPAPLVVVIVGTLINEAFGRWWPSWQLTAARNHVVQLTVPGSFAEFSALMPKLDLRLLMRSDIWVVAATIALVGSIETLLCIEATDKIDPAKRNSDTNRELRAQGVGNVISGLLGGLPVTSVIVRSSANVYAGARTRLACFVHGLVMVVAVGLFAALLNRIPLAALASVLLVVGYKLSSRKIILEMWLKGWSQFIPFMVTLLAIVFTDLLRGIGIGLLSSLYFVVRTNHHSAITLVNQDNRWLLRFNKDMSFVNKAELKRRLSAIPDRSVVIVDGNKSMYVDGDIYETLKDFETAASFRGIQLQFHNYYNKQITA